MPGIKKASRWYLKVRSFVWVFGLIAIIALSAWSVRTTGADEADIARASAIFTNPASIGIPEQGSGNPYPSEITVAGLSGNIATTPGSVAVTLNNFTHPFPSDVGIVLIGPTGAALLLMDGVTDGTEGSPAANITFTISDAGSAVMPEFAPLVNGTTYRPTSYFANDSFPPPGPGTVYALPAPAGTATFGSVYADTAPNGVWRLYVADFVAGDLGSIAGGWTLNITTNAPPATPTPTPVGTPTPTPTPTPTAFVSGKVFTPNGQALRSAIVTLTDSQNNRRTATTGSFGTYLFDNIQVGETYVLSVSSKRYRFAPLVVTFNGSQSDVDFVGLE
jgi:subtilisin-like proprotein convertase family protein